MCQTLFSEFYLYHLIELSDNFMDKHYNGPNLSDEEIVV